MKFNFKKITAVAGTVLLTGMSLGVAAAANFPAPFDGSAGYAVVYGANSPSAVDATPANSIANYLASKTTNVAPTGGDYVLFDKGDKSRFTLGSSITSIYSTLDDNELSTVLKDGTYLNDDNNEYDYTQEIRMAGLTLSHFRDTSSPFEYEPTIGFNLASGASILNYTLDFEDAAVGTSDWSKLENTNIEMLGKNFFISDVTPTSNGLKITLLDSANSATVNEGDTQQIVVGGKTYNVEIGALSGSASSPQAKLIINGEQTNSLSEGNTYKLSDGTYVGIKDISMRDVSGTTANVEFSLGTGQIILENEQTVKVNSEDVNDLEDSNGYSFDVKAYITNTSTTIEDIVLEWKTDSKVWVGPGVEIMMPGLEAIKLSMDDFVTPAEEMTTLKDGSDNLQVTTTIEDGEVTLYLLYANSGLTAFEGIGEDATRKLVTNSSTGTSASSVASVNLNESEDSYFVATWISGNNAESYAFEISKIESQSNKNQTTLKNLASGGSDVVISEVGKTDDYGQITFKLVAANDNLGTATIAAYPVGSSGTVYMDRVVTKEGLQFMLPVDTVDELTNGNQLNLTAGHPTTWNMNFTEEDSTGNIASGTSFHAAIGLDSDDGVEPTSIPTLSELEMGRSSRVYEAYVSSALATKITFDKPSNGLNELTVTYHGDDAYAQVYLSELAATSGSAGSMVFKDTESGWKDRNVVVVGGNCVNTAAAELLGLENSQESCTVAFEQMTSANSGKYVIQSYDGFTGGRVALLVAGYTAEDTAAGAAKLISGEDVDTTVGSKYLGTVGTGQQSTIAKL